MKKKIVGIISLLSISTSAMSATFLDDKLPLVDNIKKIENNSYNIQENISYLDNAYKRGVISQDMIDYSLKQQKKFREWLSKEEPERFVLVDLSSYKIYLITSLYGSTKAKDSFIDIETPIVIGHRYHKTPSRSMNIISLKYNPTWTPTLNIMRRNARNDDGEWNWPWIKSHNFDVFAHKDGQQITWDEAKEMSLKDIFMVSPPGENNSLGKLKFETDSNQSIYFHDTNQKSYFKKESRARSSGCVRVQDPYTFAGKLLYKNKEYIEKNISTGKTFWEKVEKTPVYFYYDILEYKVNDQNMLKVTDDPYHYYRDYLNNINSKRYRESKRYEQHIKEQSQRLRMLR